MWYVRFVGDPYAMYFYPEDDNILSAKEYIRNWLGVSRLPNGTEFWRGE